GEVIERYDFDNNVCLEPIIRVEPVYPEIAKANNIQGTVKIRFHISIDCTIDNLTIIQNLSPECDNAALDVMKRLSELIKKYWKNCEDKTEETEIIFKLY
ncbi:MAG: energy transducer TonB, partial [Chlorobi bacterium]|nr:energy transducer TonB [Chlorobiota bacterium]